MTGLTAAAFLLVGQAASGRDTLQALTSRGSEHALAVEARNHPDSARLAITRHLSLAARAGDESARESQLADADRLATAWATAWRDPFLQRQVARFRRWTPADQRRKATADSLRLLGNSELGKSGPAAANAAWRRSLALSIALGDSAGQAATLGNIGAGFLTAAELDSAASYLERSRRVAESLGDFRTLGNAIGSLAAVHRQRGELARARELYVAAAALRPRTGDSRGEAADQNNLGLIEQALGVWAAATRSFEAALALNVRDRRAGPAGTNLINLGNLASLAAEYPRAIALYGRALAEYRSGNDRLGAAAALHACGVAESRRGDYPRARATLAEALSTYVETGPVAEEIAVRADLAAVLAEMGNLDGALGQLRHAESRATTAGSEPETRANLALSRADLAIQLNQLSDAERWYGSAGAMFRELGNESGIAVAEAGLAYLQLVRGDHQGARRTLEAALRRQKAGEDSRAAATTSLLLGYAMQRIGDSAEARRVVMAARTAFVALRDPAGVAASLGILGELDMASGAWRAAEADFRLAISELRERAAPMLAAGLHARAGTTLRHRGALDEAGHEFSRAIELTEQVAGSLRVDERRAGFLGAKWEPYAELALLERARGRVAEAFLTSERLRGRQLLDGLRRGRLAPIEGDRDSSLVSREQDLRRRIAGLTRMLTPLGIEGGTALRGAATTGEGSERAREELAQAQQSYADLLQTLRDKDPGYARIVMPEASNWSAVAARLRPDQAMLEYLVTDSTTLVFVITHDSLAGLDLGVGRRTLADLVDFTRSALNHPSSARGSARALWRAPLLRLHAWLVAPVEEAGLLRGKRALVVIPHAELHYLPFAALLARSDTSFLVSRYVVSYATSATAWLRLIERGGSRNTAGILALVPLPGRLPGTRSEGDVITQVFGRRATVLTGPAASESALRADAGSREVIHFATYGVLNKHNPLFSFVELAAEGTDDGRLEVHEVYGLALRARLVVLSACQTGVGAGALADVPEGDDWVGLVQAFLTAGANEVLATLWPVEDRATGQLMTEFYQAVGRGASDAESLTRAQRATLRDSRTADPFYWAGFALVGAGSE